MKESQVQREIYQNWIKKVNIKAVVPNIYFYDRFIECDTIAITQEDHVIEFEIKASKWDYLEDFKKKDKHERMENPKDLTQVPNVFYFVCPEGLIYPEEIPNAYAGLIWVCKTKTKAVGHYYLKKKLQAPTIHTEPIGADRWEELAVKLAKRIW